jgi:hypothetical protein
VRKPRGQTTMGYAFSMTFGAALFLITGLIGYRLDKHTRFKAGTPWAGEILWWQVLSGLVFACAAVWFWRKGLREIRSNVYVPELAGRDAAVSPSRRIERR